jgi:putative transposase
MASKYDDLMAALKRQLSARTLDGHGRATQFIRRQRTVGAADFVWSVVMSRFATGLPGFDQARRIFHQLSGKEIWPRPFQMRFKAATAVQLFAAAFESAVERWRQRRRIEHPLAKHFSDIVAIDSTIVQLNDRLRRLFPGHLQAAAELKATLAISVFGLVPLAARLTSRKIHDSKLFPEAATFRRGSLLLFDNAYAAYGKLGELARDGFFFVAPMRKHGVARVLRVRRGPKAVRAKVAATPGGVSLRHLLARDVRVAGTWDLDVLVRPQVGDRSEVPLRLVIRPGRKRSYFYLTNVRETWAAEAIAELYRLRWQIELVFKELKQHLSLESIPTKDPRAAQVFVWASLLALAVSRTVTAVLTPLSKLNGLAATQAVALASKALRSCLDLFVRFLALDDPPLFARYILHAIDSRATRRNRARPDSFHRLLYFAPA